MTQPIVAYVTHDKLQVTRNVWFYTILEYVVHLPKLITNFLLSTDTIYCLPLARYLHSGKLRLLRSKKKTFLIIQQLYPVIITQLIYYNTRLQFSCVN